MIKKSALTFSETTNSKVSGFLSGNNTPSVSESAILRKNAGVLLILLLTVFQLNAQIDNDGCVGANFGIDADLYSDLLQFGDQGGAAAAGTTDWFFTSGGSGSGIIDESQTAALSALMLGGGNPVYEAGMNTTLSSVSNGQFMIDAIWARESFGGTGYTDPTSYATSSKNGADPAIWDPGPSNVLGKNDLIDVAGHMRRDGTTLSDDLWFFGVINRAEPGGSAYMDFEFFIEDVTYDGATGFTSGGPQLGHTAFTFDGSGNITSVGDILFNVALINGGEEAGVEMRLWVSYSDFTTITPTGFSWGPEYDGAFNGSPYGYASIIPNDPLDACGIVNKAGENPATPPWGAIGTKSNSYQTTYADFALTEIGVNLTGFGIDHASLLGADPCDFPFSTFMVKTRASASFTAALKDFAGPYAWGQPSVESEITSGDPVLSCLNPELTLAANPLRPDAFYNWSTLDGNITSDPTLSTITIDQPGTYILSTTLDTDPIDCPVADANIEVTFDAAKPFFNTPATTTSVACSGSDGSVDLTVSGASPAYSYAWSNGATIEDPTGLAAGTYTVTITDQIGCTKEATATVNARIPTNITPTTTDIDCNGDNTGAISLAVTGQSPFTYQWSNGNTAQNISNLTAGTYTVTTTDADGCTETSAITVTEPMPLNPTVVVTDESDPALNNGSIDLTMTGGTSPYTFDWSNDGPDTPDDDPEDPSGLARGSYTVTVTDAKGCTTTLTTFVYEPEVCDDGIDNDGDGLSDCSDSDCQPDMPGSITPGDPAPCVGDIGVTYTIAAIPGVTVYQWSVPAGATITAGQGSTSITLDWTGTQGGQICVQSDNVGCLSATSCLTVTPNDTPVAPSTIIISN